MLSVSSLPASYGDCLWIEYGSQVEPNVILIDAGPAVPTALKKRLTDLAERKGVLELVVVTHVDADHIGGMLTLLREGFYGVPIRDFWFNGFRHLPGPETFGEKQGETLTGLLLSNSVAWNVDRKNDGFMVDDGKEQVINLPGGAKIALLSPDANQLERLKTEWIKVCGEADLYGHIEEQKIYFGKEGREGFGGAGILNVGQLANEDFEEDTAVANGSSIAFVVEYDGARVLFGADAFPSRLLSSLEDHYGTAPYHFDLVKVPHHGSENNVSIDFIEALDCPRYLFSSNGCRYKHPSRQAVARVVKHGKNPNLIFNYRTEFNAIWDEAILKHIHKFSTTFGDESGVTIKIDKPASDL